MLAPTVMQAVVTAALTVLTGVLVLVVGRLLELLSLEPVREQRKAIAEIDNNLTFLANRYSNPITPEQWKGLDQDEKERIRAEANTIRRDASHLLAATNAILVGYGCAKRFGWTPDRDAVTEAVRNLILISNRFVVPPSPPSGDVKLFYITDDAVNTVRALLGLRSASSRAAAG